jgi:hypothetical protein
MNRVSSPTPYGVVVMWWLLTMCLRRLHRMKKVTKNCADGNSRGDLYDPLTMPAPLLKAHQELDRTVDRCYRPDPFPSDRHRVEYLFALYEKITALLVADAKPKRKRR